MPLKMDTPVIDLIYGADAQPTPESMIEALGGEAAAATRMILDVDLDAPQYETDISPTIMLRRRGERRLIIVDEQAQPMRKNPRTEPIIAKDLRPERDRLAAIVEKTGARLGRLGSFGSWGEAAIVVRQPVDLRAILLLGWALDPATDVDGRRRASQLSQKEFEEKLTAYPRRLEELDDLAILSRVPPATLTRKGTLLIVDVLSDRDGSWDVRKSYELEKRVAATDLFARIPGARVPVPASEASEQRPTVSMRAMTPPPVAAEPAPAAARVETPAARAPTAPSPPPVAEPPAPPKPAGPPIVAAELAGRLILRLPAERFDTDAIGLLSKKSVDIVGAADRLSGAQKDQMHRDGYGFVAPLAFLSEVFVEGKPLDKKRLEAEGRPGPDGTRVLEVHLPRFGPVLLVDGGPGQRWVTSETAGDVAALLAIARG
jgi:hypothetical protein